MVGMEKISEAILDKVSAEAENIVKEAEAKAKIKEAESKALDKELTTPLTPDERIRMAELEGKANDGRFPADAYEMRTLSKLRIRAKL